jgi:hypothetical protein
MNKRRLKWIVGLVAVYLIAAAVAPRFPMNLLHDPAQHALESALGRTAEIGDVRLRLLPLPGFTIENVTIAEDPAVGAEPIAYVTTLEATPGFGVLIGRPLSFSSVNLEDASLNLTRVDRPDEISAASTHWNFSTLMSDHLLTSFPSVHLRGGRINFKFNDTKSVFYLLDTDVDLSPPATGAGEWTLSVRAQPARTDRRARGFGSLTAKGVWNPRENGVALDVKLEKSQLSDMLTLFNGQESGIYGDISGNAHLAGPVSRIGFAGLLNVSNIHGWDQLPPGGSAWPLAISGTLNAPEQIFDMSASLNMKESPFAIHYRVSDYLRTPRWGVTANVKNFPLAPLTPLARNLGVQIPEKIKLEGSASGAVGYSLPAGVPRMDGQIVVAGARISVTGGNALKIPHADLRFSGSTISLSETHMENASGESAALSASWDAAGQRGEAEISSAGMSIAALPDANQRSQISLPGVPLLSAATSGKWSGRLRYVSSPDPAADRAAGSGWEGDIHIEDASIAFEAFAEPIHIASAVASIQGAALDVKQARVSLGGIEAQGEYHYDPSARRPHRFRLIVPKADAAQMEKLLMPTLHRGSFISYAFNFGRAPEPDWLRTMRGDGTIQIIGASLGGQDFAGVRARVVWDGDRIQLASLAARMDGAAFAGSALIQLAAREPVYTVKGTLTDLAWHSGSITTEASLTSSGTGAALLANLKANGTFRGRSVNLAEMAPLDVYDSVSGTFDWASETRGPHLRLGELVLKNADATYQGAGELDDSGRLVLHLSDGLRQIQATGGLHTADSLKPSIP